MKTGIVMGSDSDLPVMKEAADFLGDLGIPYEITIVSAHRTPKRLYEYAETAVDRGLKVIIAGAGGAAHLPGMIAAITTLPVIGVPVKTKALGGVDSLYSIVQMPPGIPVATVAINGAKNAGILAASILSIYNEDISKKLRAYKEGLDKMVHDKIEKLDRAGYEAYLKEMP
ncbi:MAG: 5-(carboxyamino)imidazole ribonucleotide mutase [Synergistaceae bacterium]|nr:5-(carboxyamino)imidazole ribonucleotide mutase [Synergistaceae bacterium]